MNNLYKSIIITINSNDNFPNYQKPIKTINKFPEGYQLISVTTQIGFGGIDISANESYYKDIFKVNIGKSKDGYIQYSITECSHTGNGHQIFLLFKKNN